MKRRETTTYCPKVLRQADETLDMTASYATHGPCEREEVEVRNEERARSGKSVMSTNRYL